MTSFLLLLKKTLLIMDKVSAATKLTLKGTAGVVVDDLVVGATKASEFDTEREKKSVFAIRKGALKYLFIILIVLFTVKYFNSDIIKWILVVGGLFLSFEAYHGLLDLFKNESDTIDDDLLSDDEKIQSAIKTSIVLNTEIVVIAISMVEDYSFMNQIFAVTFAAIFMTYAIYGIVLGLVRTDDVGLELMGKNDKNSFKYKLGYKLVIVLPYIMKALMYIGIYAMALIGGQILIHNIGYIYNLYENYLSITSGYIYEPLFAISIGYCINIFIDIFKKINKKKEVHNKL